MTLLPTAEGGDFSEIRSRIESIGAGLRLTLVLSAAGFGYATATWEQPNRPLIASICGLGAVLALLVYLLPHERIVRSGMREPFFVLWSVANIALAAGLAAADGGAQSPYALLFFLPLILAALSYPLWSVVAIGVLDYLAYLAVGVLAGRPAPEYAGFFALCLAATALLCAWQASTQERRRRELSRVSRADPLTGALNRRGFAERFEAELSGAARSGRPLGLVMLDLDRFKQVNDVHGHAAGDEILRWTVSSLQPTLRPTDALARIGGDEFAILLPAAGRYDTTEIAQRVRATLAERVSVSVGVACFPLDGADRDELERHADAELYAGKKSSPLFRPSGKELSWATALAQAVDDRMAVKHEHSLKVAEYAGAIARQLGWPEAELELLHIAAILHDVGKVSVPDHILRKPGELTEKEWAEIRKHPLAGADIVARIEGLEPIVPWIRHAQEHFDGSGYPDELSGEAIPLAARILHVANAFDSMTTDRPHRPAISHDEALAEVRRHAGTQFDERCVTALENYLRARSPTP
jgi:diguanylate cyclase (GGDEF)-like protein/putative nucleotidyltransferase with HDIG domain